MYHVFINIKEFVNNGGYVNHNRAVFACDSANNTYHIIGMFMEFGEDDQVIIKSSMGTFQLISTLVFVKVKAVPVYE